MAGASGGQHAPEHGLRGSRILVVEDEFYLADDLAEVLRDCGADVVGPVATVADATELARTGIDCAVLDMNLRGEMAFALADRLNQAGIPFVIATGYNSASLPERFADHPRLEKPFSPDQAIPLIAAAVARGN
jgi:CheY-like chemotaxis protein